MLGRLACGAWLLAALLSSSPARANCPEEISKLMSKDTEKLATRFQRVAKRIEMGGQSPSLLAEECRIARQLGPKLEDQIAALKQSGCMRDPSVRAMVSDIVRGHEDDLAMLRKATARSECR